MAPPTNLLVFRNDSEEVAGITLAMRLREALSRIADGRLDSIVGALIVAGEIECVLADCDCPLADKAALVTDTFARALVGIAAVNLSQITSSLSTIEPALPDLVRVSHPEGFAYYALHPADFVDPAIQCVTSESAAIIGIRSIGTTASAVATAALACRGVFASRITVRPLGHPYDRKLEFTKPQADWLEEYRKRNATFLVVDEGPGLSGSSFLSVAEAVERCGISPSRITMIGTHRVDPAQLCARDAVRRWGRYNWRSTDSTIGRMYSEHIPVSAGAWRNEFLVYRSQWPSCWPEMESLKFLSSDRSCVFKFEGLGQHGERSRLRAEALYNAGFSPRPIATEQGMTRYDVVSGVPLSRDVLAIEVLDRIADYCAFRAENFGAFTQNDELAEMVRFNLSQELECHVKLPAAVFNCDSPVIPDCRMQPHKWIQATSGTIIKVDGVCDGEGHFLPGPTDILWDLAGAIVEWNMNSDAEAYLVAQFQRHSGRISELKLAGFVLAYSVLRLSYARMARSSTQDTAEKPRLQKSIRYYRRQIDKLLRPFTSAPIDHKLRA